MEFLRSCAEIAEIDEKIAGVTPHAADDLVLATALSGHADVLVTGDVAFLGVGEW